MPIRIGRRAASFYSSKFYKALASAVTRFYYRFNGVDSHVALPEITIGGPSRRLSFTVNTTQTGADWALVASADFAGNEGYILAYVDNPDGLQLIIGTTSGFSRHVFGEQAAICNGEDNTVSLGYEEGVVTAYLNGAPIGPPAAVDQVDWYLSGVVDGAANLFGGSGARYLSGVAKNANFQGTLTANGQTYSELNYPIIFDNIGDTIVRETVNGDGPELVVNGDASDGINSWNGVTSILSVENGRFRLDNSAAYQSVNQTFATVAGASYVVNGGLDVGTADGYYQIRDGSGVVIAERVSPPTIVTAQTDSMNIRLHTGAAVGTCYFSNVSVKQTLDGQLINAQDADYIEV